MEYVGRTKILSRVCPLDCCYDQIHKLFLKYKNTILLWFHPCTIKENFRMLYLKPFKLGYTLFCKATSTTATFWCICKYYTYFLQLSYIPNLRRVAFRVSHLGIRAPRIELKKLWSLTLTPQYFIGRIQGSFYVWEARNHVVRLYTAADFAIMQAKTELSLNQRLWHPWNLIRQRGDIVW